MFSKREVVSTVIAMGGLLCSCATAFSSCEDVYKNSTRNYSFHEYDYRSLNAVFDRHCERNGERKKFAWDSSMGVVIEGLPVNMTGNAKADLEKMQNFCKAYSSVRYDEAHQRAGTNTVVVEALANFNACKAIESRAGILITHQFADPESVIVNFRFKGEAGTQVIAVQGVATSKNLTCRSNRASRTGKNDVVNDNTRFEERANFAILCRRASQNGKDGIVTFSPSTLAIATNIESYTLSMPSDSIYSNQLASEATKTIEGLKATNATLAGEKAALQGVQKQLQNLSVEAHGFVISQFNPGGAGRHFGCGTNHESAANEVCAGAPKRSPAVQLADTPGGQCGTARFVVACARY